MYIQIAQLRADVAHVCDLGNVHANESCLVAVESVLQDSLSKKVCCYCTFKILELGADVAHVRWTDPGQILNLILDRFRYRF